MTTEIEKLTRELREMKEQRDAAWQAQTDLVECRLALSNERACRETANKLADDGREKLDAARLKFSVVMQSNRTMADALNHIRVWLTSPDLSPMTLQHVRQVVRIGLGLPDPEAK